MARPSILNSLERKFILLVGDMFIIIASLNVLVNYGIDKNAINTSEKIGLFGLGVFAYISLAYILDFYNLEKVSKRLFTISQSFYISALYVFVVFMFSVFVFDVGFWRIPLLFFLLLTPVEIALWRFFFGNVFRIIPVTKKVLYIYGDGTENSLKDDIETIDGKEMNTFYKVKLTYSVDQNTLDNKKFFLTATDKIDAWIINTKNYTNFPKDLENILLKSILQGKEVISYTSFYENTYEAMPIKSHNDSFYEILQLKNKKIRYLQRLFSFGVNFFFVIVGRRDFCDLYSLCFCVESVF